MKPFLPPSAVRQETYTSFASFAGLGAGLTCGFANLASGIAIGIVGDATARNATRQPKIFTPMILILIFAEALGLYGLLVAVIIQGRTKGAE